MNLSSQAKFRKHNTSPNYNIKTMASLKNELKDVIASFRSVLKSQERRKRRRYLIYCWGT